jgi:hypothetical protein
LKHFKSPACVLPWRHAFGDAQFRRAMTKTVQHTDFLLIGVSLLLLFAASLTGAAAATCTDDSLPPATLGNDKAQIETLPEARNRLRARGQTRESDHAFQRCY